VKTNSEKIGYQKRERKSEAVEREAEGRSPVGRSLQLWLTSERGHREGHLVFLVFRRASCRERSAIQQ
jgi:hypothetical protein